MSAISATTMFSLRRRTMGLRLLAPTAVALLPTLVLVLAIAFSASVQPLELYRQYLVPLTLYFVLPFVTMFMMLPVLSELYDRGAIGYIYTRPVPRWQPLFGLFLGAFLGMLPVYLIGGTVPAVICYLADPGVGIGTWLQLVMGITSVLWIASLAYGAICVFLGVWSKRAIIHAFIILVVLGSVLGSLPGDGQMFSLHYYLIGLAHAWCGITDSATDLFPPVTEMPSVLTSLLVIFGTTVAMMYATSAAAKRRDVL
jgi:ABC-type transport system involved in multi-copper enzyme maturation permease subunit